jgi:mannose-6-phosphate isomerase-like protein (cupin superfamily)
MLKEELLPGRGSYLRKNNSEWLTVTINCESRSDIMFINSTSLTTKYKQQWTFNVAPHKFYMIINIGESILTIKYNNCISEHEIVYDPYKYENSEKKKFNPDDFVKEFSISDGYIDILSKWYSIKFTYPKYNLIFIKPEMGISIQIHTHRSEKWEILSGKPIVINDNRVHYFVEKGTKFINEKMKFHSIINPNKDPKSFVAIKEQWSGSFDEEDIKRVYNPNNYL